MLNGGRGKTGFESWEERDKSKGGYGVGYRSGKWHNIFVLVLNSEKPWHEVLYCKGQGKRLCCIKEEKKMK